MNKKLELKSNFGITLIALIITIIVLLILAGVTFNVVIGENGMFGKANVAKEETNKNQVLEELKIKVLEVQTEKGGNASLKDVIEALKNDKDNEYEIYTELDSSNGYKLDITDDTQQIYVNYKKYKFKIDNKLIVTFLNSDKETEEDSEKQQTGLISNTEYRINNETLNFSHIAVVGRDEELKTFKEGIDYLLDNGYKENSAILLREGSYNFHEIQTGSSYNIGTKYNGMKVSIIGDSPGGTYLNSGEMVMTENGANYSIELKFYRIIFLDDYYGNGTFHLNGDKDTKEYYNCVFEGAIGGYNGIISNASINTYNCLFEGGANNSFYKKYPLEGIAQNCASKDTTIDPYNGSKETCLTNITLNEEYEITSDGWKNTGTGTNPDGTQANIGVYGGKYSW